MKCITRKHSEFNFFSYPRFVGFAAKGPEKKAPEVKAEGFKAPEAADKKPLDELKKSEDLKMGQIEGAHMKVKADVQKAKETAKTNFEKSTKTEADKKAYDAFVAQMDKMNTDADQARVDLFSKLDAQNEAKREKERKAADERMKSALLGKDVQISKMEQKGKFVAKLEAQATTPHAAKDSADAVMANMDNHDFDGDDFQNNADPGNKYINYQNKSRSMAEGYLRAQIAMGQQGKGEKDLQAAYNADEGFGPELLRDHTITEENLRKQMDIEAFIKTVDISSDGKFLTDNERIYVATLMKEAASLWGSDNKDTKQYRDFVEARLKQIAPLLQANKEKATLMLASVDHSTISKGVGVVTGAVSGTVGAGVGLAAGPVGSVAVGGAAAVGGYEAGRRATRNALTPDAIRDAYNQCAEYERNLVMNTIPAPKEWVDHKDKYQDNPEVSDMEVKMRTDYVEKVKTYVPRAEALWAYADAGVTKKYIENWQTDIDHGLERGADGSFVRKDMNPDYVVKWEERMKSDPATFIDGWKQYLQTEGPRYPTASAKAAELVASLEDVKNNFDGKKPEEIRDIMKRADRMKGNIEDGLYGPAQAVPEGGAPAPAGTGDKPAEPGKPGETPAVGPDGKPVPAAEGGAPAPAGDSAGGGSGRGRRGGKGGGEGGKGEKGKEGAEKTADQLKEDAMQLESDTKNAKQNFDAIKDKKAGDADAWAKKAEAWKATADKWVEKAKAPKTDALKSQKDATEADVAAKKAVEDLKKVAPPVEKGSDAPAENKEKGAAEAAKKLADTEKAKFDALPKDAKPEDVLKAAQSYLAKAKDWQNAAKGWADKDGKNADATGMKEAADKMVIAAQEAVKTAQETVRDNTPTVFEPDLAKLTVKNEAFRKRYDALGSNRKSNYDDYMKWSLRAQEVVASGKQLKFENGSSKYPAVAFLKNGKVFWKPGRDPEAKVPVIKNLNEWYMDKLEKEGQKSPESVEKDFNRQIEDRLSRVEKDATQWDRVNKNLPLGYIGNGIDSRKMTVSPSITYVPGPNPGQPVGSVDGPRYEYFIDTKKVADRNAFKKAILDNIKSIPENNS